MKRHKRDKFNFRRRIEAEENAVLDFQFQLLELLKATDVTQDELATRLGVTKSAISQIFAAGANPTTKMVARIFDALDCKVAMQAVPLDKKVVPGANIKDQRLRDVHRLFDLPPSSTWQPIQAANQNAEDHEARAVA